MQPNPPSDGSVRHRIAYPPFLVFLLGGVLGTSFGLGVASLCYYAFGWPAIPSFFLGVLANELFHHVYYHILWVNREIRLRTSLPIQVFLYVLVAALSTVPLYVLFSVFRLGFPVSALISVAMLSVLNVLVNRIATFGSAVKALEEYETVAGTFYEDQLDAHQVGRFRAWYHRSRFERLGRLVSEHYQPGMNLVDLGCGSCNWNTAGVPVHGLDINAGLMATGMAKGRLACHTVTDDLARTGRPDGGADLVIISEVLEHVADGEAVLREIARILKDDGRLILTVPYDFFLGPFFVLFNLNCLYQGFVKGSRYHQFRCGHVHHFTKARLTKMLAQSGFTNERLFVVNALLLYSVWRKAG